jgi:hypothetical protein
MKEIKDFPGYYITICGKIWSAPKQGRGGHNGKWLKPQKLRCKDGSYYLRVELSKNGKIKNKQIHRLVAEAYIPNPDEKPEVNHKDTDKTNNSVLNLEWNTSGENEQHAWDNGLRENARKAISKAVSKAQSKKVVCIETGEIFSSARAASKHIGLSTGAVSQSIRDRCRAGGYHWKYI